MLSHFTFNIMEEESFKRIATISNKTNRNYPAEYFHVKKNFLLHGEKMWIKWLKHRLRRLISKK